ncbi:MAG: hypothetical protein RL637_622 [Pseudomonadota bacterium]
MAKNQLLAKPLTLEEIALYYKDCESSLRLYFSSSSPSFEQRFISYTFEEISVELDERISELGHSTSLSLLAALEAVFRIDYKERVEKRKKDCLSKALRMIHQTKELKASLEEDIFNAWLENTDVKPKLIEDLKGAFKYRHWLAHGRYWTPKMGRPDYEYSEIYQLTESIFSSFPFEGI